MIKKSYNWIKKKNGMKDWQLLLSLPFITIILIVAFLSIFFPPMTAQGLRFQGMEDMESDNTLLSFQPQIPNNPTREIEVDLKHKSVQIVAKVENNAPDIEKLVDGTEYLEDGTDLNRLAYAVARHETGAGKFGYGLEYNNHHGIKNGNTAPCPKIGRNNMCIYEDSNESYVAFKKIWKKWYRTYPNITLAEKYTSKDRAWDWLSNVDLFFNQ